VIYDVIPLPIELLAINAKTKKDGILIDWSTTTEINNNYFTIERSFDGRNFQAIAIIPGNGTTTEISNYAFLDDNPEIGLNYYRLKQTDFDGKYSYSKVVSAAFERGIGIQVFPTIVEDILTIQRTKEYNWESSIIIYSITGRVFKNTIIADDEFTKDISLASLVPGIYFVSIYSNESVKTFKIVKL